MVEKFFFFFKLNSDIEFVEGFTICKSYHEVCLRGRRLEINLGSDPIELMGFCNKCPRYQKDRETLSWTSRNHVVCVLIHPRFESLRIAKANTLRSGHYGVRIPEEAKHLCLFQTDLTDSGASTACCSVGSFSGEKMSGA